MITYYLLVSILPLTLHPFWTMFVGEFTMIKYLGGAALIAAVFHLAGGRRIPGFLETPQSRAFLALLGVASISYLSHGLPFSWEHSPLISFISFFVFYVVTIALVDSRNALRWSLLVAVGSVAWATLYVVREFQKFGGRPGWVVGDPNYYTMSAILVIPVAYFFFSSSGLPRWQRLFCLGSLVLILVGVALAASRGGFIGLSVAIAYLTARSGHRKRAVLLFVAIAGPILFLAPDSPLRRLFAPNVHDAQSVEIREILWAAGWLMIQQYPLTGIGLGNFKYVVPLFQPDADRPYANIAHNTYIEMTAETGLPGLLAFVATLALTLYSLETVRRGAGRAHDRFLVAVATGLQAGLLGYAANAVFISAQYQKLMWLMVFLSMTLPGLLRASLARTQAETWANAPGDRIRVATS